MPGNINDAKQMNFHSNPDNSISQNPVLTHRFIAKRAIYFVVLILFLLSLIILNFYFLNNKKETGKTTPRKKEITTGWKTYKGIGLIFRYPAEWTIEEISSFDEKELRFSTTIEDNRDFVMGIKIIRNYIPKPGISDKLKSYLGEFISTTSGSFAKSITFKNRKALMLTDNKEDYFQDTSNLVIDLPEQSGLIHFYLTDFTSKLSLGETFEKYYTPLLESIEIGDTTWTEISPTLSSDTSLDTSSWKVYNATQVTLRHPYNWKVREEIDRQFSNITNLILTRADSKKYDDYSEIMPRIIIGSPAVFSTSGAICGGQKPGECMNMGVVRIKIKEKNYYANIIDKNFRHENKTLDFYPSFYVFSLEPNRVPSSPAITVLFRDLKQGQEIIDILSTISY